MTWWDVAFAAATGVVGFVMGLATPWPVLDKTRRRRGGFNP